MNIFYIQKWINTHRIKYQHFIKASEYIVISKERYFKTMPILLWNFCYSTTFPFILSRAFIETLLLIIKARLKIGIACKIHKISNKNISHLWRSRSVFASRLAQKNTDPRARYGNIKYIKLSNCKPNYQNIINYIWKFANFWLFFFSFQSFSFISII